MPRFNPRSVEQQMKRYNISREEAEEKVLQVIENKKASNPYSVDYQMKKYGLSQEEAEEKITVLKQKTATGHLIADTSWQMKRFGLSQEEAEEKIKKTYERRGKSTSAKKKENPSSHFNTIEYWCNKGFSLEEAKIKKEEHILYMQSAFQKEIKKNPVKYKARTPMQIHYWLKRGYSLEEANILRKERQRTFTLDRCIEKYGEKDGIKKWKDRQAKWVKSLHNNFNLHGDGRSPQSIWAKEIIRILCGYLKIETPVKEKWIASKDNELRCSYDFTYNKKIIEFNGDFWHAHPNLFQADEIVPVLKISAKEKWELDKKKKELAESYGYEVLVIWESEYGKDKETIINKCIKFLNNN